MAGLLNLRARRISALLLVVLTLVSLTFAQFSLPAMAQANGRTRLVLLLVGDQFSYNYLARYQDKFTSGGFRLLLDRGANYTNCRYQHATTQSAVGHAIIATGSYPWANGIVADEWYNRRKARNLTAVSDDNAQLVGANGTAGSTRLLQGTTIGDQMKLASNGRSKVIAVSLKDKSSLLMGGRLATNAWWWDTKTGAFVTSSQYGREVPSWVQAFNDQHYSEKFVGKPWQRLMPETQYGASTRDDYPHERPLPNEGRQFPHVIGAAGAAGEPFYTSFAMTPWANQMLCDFSREAIEREALGQHTDADLLAVSFSSGELLGQSFGPYSQEVEDLCLRLDQSLANLFQYVDQKIGLDNCLIVFTADHGVVPMPEFLKERGVDGGRVDPKVFKNLLDSALDQRLGQDDWIEAFEPPNLYLNLGSIEKQKFRQPEVEALASKLALTVPGIGEAYTAGELLLNQLPSGPYTEAVRKSYYWGRSGELYIMPKPGYIFISETNGTNSGSPYVYDTQVPLLLMGGQVQGGRYGHAASPADVAPTIATILGIESPALCEGKVLAECLLNPPRARVSIPDATPVDPKKKR